MKRYLFTPFLFYLTGNITYKIRQQPVFGFLQRRINAMDDIWDNITRHMTFQQWEIDESKIRYYYVVHTSLTYEQQRYSHHPITVLRLIMLTLSPCPGLSSLQDERDQQEQGQYNSKELELALLSGLTVFAGLFAPDCILKLNE